jgi:hypothetical protein
VIHGCATQDEMAASVAVFDPTYMGVIFAYTVETDNSQITMHADGMALDFSGISHPEIGNALFLGWYIDGGDVVAHLIEIGDARDARSPGNRRLVEKHGQHRDEHP